MLFLVKGFVVRNFRKFMWMANMLLYSTDLLTPLSSTYVYRSEEPHWSHAKFIRRPLAQTPDGVWGSVPFGLATFGVATCTL